MNNKLVSIIMGVYNCANRIENCVESIKNQTYVNWELIICDDCSTDNSWEILQKLQKEDSRIILIQNKKNSKLAYSLNHCLKYARGEYVARMDDDDLCLPKRLEVQVNFLETHPEFDVVGTWANVTDGKNVLTIRKLLEYPNRNNLLTGPCHMHPTIMMRKRAYDKLGGYTVCKRTNRGQDWDLWFRFYAAGMKGYNIQEAYLEYHESKEDFKKRSIKTAVMYTKTALYGYRLLKYPLYKYIYALKPLISNFIPNKIIQIYRRRG